MGYTNVFGGELIFPSQLSYLSLTTAVDVTLQWPTEQQITGDNVVADFMDVDTTNPSLNIDMPSALVTGTGNKGNFNNVGANTFTVRDSTGGTIQSVAPGETWVIVLRDNTTAAGLWRTFQMGASVSVASASALAGAGIKAIGMLLNQKIDSDVEAATPITVVDGDRAKCLIYTGGVGQADLPAAAGVGNDWFFMLRNSGSGTLTIVPPSGTIDGSADLALDPNGSTFVFTDGSNWFTIGLTVSSTIAFDFVSLPVPGSGDFTLSGANLDRIAYRFTGTLTGNKRIVVPNTIQQYWCDNQTTGAFTLRVSTFAQASPPNVGQNEAAIFYCDSTDVINAVSEVSVTLPLVIGQGGTGATTAADARTNLSVPPNSRDLIAGAGLTGGGDLTSDRTFDVGAGTGITVNADDVQLELASTLNVDHAAVDLLAGTGIDATGLGDITVDRTINLDTTSNLNIDHSGVTLTAGDGLDGGGDITLSRTFDVNMLGLQDLTDPAADRIIFFDNSSSMTDFLVVGDGLAITLLQLDVDMLGLQDLSSPGADRIYFFDQSSGFADFLTLGSGLAITGTELDTVGGAVGTVFAGFVDSTASAEQLPAGWTATAGGGTIDVVHSLGLGASTDLSVNATVLDAGSNDCKIVPAGTGVNGFRIISYNTSTGSAAAVDVFFIASLNV